MSLNIDNELQYIEKVQKINNGKVLNYTKRCYTIPRVKKVS